MIMKMDKHSSLHIKPEDFHNTVKKLREFFDSKGFIEMHTQNRLSILAACEDPFNLATFTYAGEEWALPQTGQMWLEVELLKNPGLKGVYCVSTSYRNEPNPVPGRHDLIFPMFEFESHGNIEDLIKMEKELLQFLGFGDSFKEKRYTELAGEYGVKELGHEHETLMCKEYGKGVLLRDFPEYTDPFWNMARYPHGEAKKVDVILEGIETIGSAERSTSPLQMKSNFYSIVDGNYAKTLFSRFSKERVMSEVEEFLKLDFVPRYGGGIGLTRLIRAMKLNNLL